MFFSTALPAAFIFLATNPSLVSANGRDQQPDDLDADITNIGNVRYTADLTVGGQTMKVILDTGSTDLWLNPPGGVGSFENTGVTHKIAYGQGDTFINGTIGLAEMSIAGHTIPRQAFINVTENVGLDGSASGMYGLVGLGFDSPTAGIEKALTAGGYDGPEVGKSVLSSIFDMNPDKGRFFAISLSRLGDVKDTADASLSIAEYDEKYAGVQWLAKRPVFPATAKSWHILSDGATVNGAAVPWMANDASTPVGQLRIGLDTGTTNIIVRPEIRDQIYAAVPGAVLAKNSTIKNRYWSADKDVWIVPCNTSVSFSAIFGGQPYPIHPLDLTELRTQVGPDGVKYTICVGSVTNGGSITSGTTDALYGDSFLRNVYTVYSFGDNETSPYIQFLSQTNEWEATQDFAHVRQEQLAQSPPEIAPADLIRLFDGVSVTATTSISSPSSTAQAAAGHLVAAAVTSGTDSPTGANYFPAIIGLLAANLLVVLVLAFLAVMGFVRRNKTVGATRSPSIRYVPAKVRDDSLMRPSFAEDMPYSDS